MRLTADQEPGNPETDSPKAENAIPINNPFSQEELTKAWKDYANLSEDIYLKNTLLYVNPQLKDDYRIEVAVLNPEQANYFQTAGTAIREYLFSSLKNRRIELDIRIKEEDHTQTLFTDREKYSYMVDKNPSLKNLVTEFNLRLD